MKKMYSMMSNRKGFTLIELIIVIAIIGILAAIVVPRLTGFQQRANTTQALVSAKQIATAIDVFQVDNGRWPTNSDADRAIVLATAGITLGTDTLQITVDAGGTGTGGFIYTAANGTPAGRTNGAAPVR